MLLPQLLTLTLALTPALVSAALFPKDSLVKMIDAKQFKKIMKENQTTIVAFVAPWCGHCQKLAPEYSRAAVGLYPLIPTYAVDCDQQKNKKLCAEQGVQGFPTLKLFPRGARKKPLLYEDPNRTASALYYWGIRNIPHGVTKLYHLDDVPGWIEANIDHPRALLVNNNKGIPLLWQVLGNKYKDNIKFSVHRDRGGKSSGKMGLVPNEKGQSQVLIYPPGSTDFILYEGIQKLDSLSKFFDSVIDGSADLHIVNQEAAREQSVPDPAELEIERLQEEQKIALLHGGFADMAEFQEALKNGAGADFHQKNGFPGKMDGPKADEKKKEKKEDPIHKILKAQQEAAEKSANAPKMDKTGASGEQVVIKAPKSAEQPRTSAPPESSVAAEETSTIAAPPAFAQQPTAPVANEPAEETVRAKDEL